MDTLTHALSGALLGRATASRDPVPNALSLRARMAIGFCAAAFPDCDIVVTPLAPLAYLYNHRGVTHSLLVLPLWAVLIGLASAYLIWRNPARWRACAGMAALGIAAHIVADLIT